MGAKLPDGSVTPLLGSDSEIRASSVVWLGLSYVSEGPLAGLVCHGVRLRAVPALMNS